MQQVLHEVRRTNRMIGFLAWLAGGVTSGLLLAALLNRFGGVA
jgi:hypothetical protein